MAAFNDVILVGIDVENEGIPVLIVGRKQPGDTVDIVNSFQGKEALDLYEKLVKPVNPEFQN